MDDEMEGLWKEETAAYCEVLCPHSPGGTGENHKKKYSGQSASRTRYFSNANQNHYRLSQLAQPFSISHNASNAK
jgi:hypothetical protein